MSTGETEARKAPWMVLIFSLPARLASQRVEVWRKLRRYGACPLRSSGYILPNTEANQERFHWLAAMVRKYQGSASVASVEAFDDLPYAQLVNMFREARSRDYQELARKARKLGKRQERRAAQVALLRRRFQEIAAIDFFESPLRGPVELLLAGLDAKPAAAAKKAGELMRKQYKKRTWITRPRPGIDRVSCAWLIQRSIDPDARFTFGDDPGQRPGAVPFDMFGEAGFGHRGEDCTFETLCREFAIRDPATLALAQMIHDADLHDEKFGRPEAEGIDRVLTGWARQGVSDSELLKRGMQMIAGLYKSLN